MFVFAFPIFAKNFKLFNYFLFYFVYGKSLNKAGVISFNVKNQHPFDVGTLLDKYGIAVRTGHHCTQPLMSLLGIQGTIRISFAIYNTKQEIDFFIEKLKKVITMLN